MLGVNLRADDGAPSVETVVSHSLTELSVEMSLLISHLEQQQDDEPAMHVTRFRDRVDLIRECAGILSAINATSQRPSRGAQS